MKWFIKVLRHYADFSGRARRREYWMFVLFNMIFSFAWGVVATLAIGLILGWDSLSDRKMPMLTNRIALYYLAVMLLPAMALMVRRLHDLGKSGWWWFITFIPVVGGVWLFVLMCTEGEAGANRYGDNPKTSPETFGRREKTKSAGVALTVAASMSILMRILLEIHLLLQETPFTDVMLPYGLFEWIIDLLLLTTGICLLNGSARNAVQTKIKTALYILSAAMLIWFVLYIFSLLIRNQETGWMDVRFFLHAGLWRVSMILFSATLLFSPRSKGLIRTVTISLVVFLTVSLLWNVYDVIRLYMDAGFYRANWAITIREILTPLFMLMPVAFIVLAATLPGIMNGRDDTDKKEDRIKDETPNMLQTGITKPIEPKVENTHPVQSVIKTYSHPDYATHVRMAVNDLCAICGSASLNQNRQWIRNVGQDLYDTHHFQAMQDVFIQVKTRYPMYQAALSQIWDGVGGWAD